MNNLWPSCLLYKCYKCKFYEYICKKCVITDLHCSQIVKYGLERRWFYDEMMNFCQEFRIMKYFLQRIRFWITLKCTTGWDEFHSSAHTNLASLSSIRGSFGIIVNGNLTNLSEIGPTVRVGYPKRPVSLMQYCKIC